MKENPYFSKKSLILIGIILLILVIFAGIFYSKRENGNTVVITHNGKTYGTYPISEDKVIKIKDSQGKLTNTVVIADGEVYMKSADCPDQICVHQGHKSKDGESITCLPNKVVVEVKGNDHSDMDTMTN